MKKFFITTIILCIVLFSFGSFADGWVQDGNTYRYLDQGEFVKTSFVQPGDGFTYYLDDSGNMAANSWIKTEDTLKTYYAGSNGKLYMDGIYTIDGQKYMFNSDCLLMLGWSEDYEYYGDLETGELTKGWKKIILPVDWRDYDSIYEDNEAWFYFGTDYKKVFADSEDNIVKQINSKYYCFDRNGVMRTGWRYIKDTNPTIKGYMFFNRVTSENFQYGQAIMNCWYACEAPAFSNINGDTAWFYFGASGYPKSGTSDGPQRILVGEKYYLLNEYGNPIYGIRKIGEDYYYFGSSETDCSMKTGTFTITDGSGEKRQYYFTNSGKGYTGIVNDKMYYKGRLQKADPDVKFEAFCVGDTTRLVNSNGFIQKGRKKVNDGDGCAWSTSSTGIITLWGGTLSDVQVPEVNTD